MPRSIPGRPALPDPHGGGQTGCIHADTPVLRARIDAGVECPGNETLNEKVRAFRRRRIDAYEQALATWLRDEADADADIIDTTQLTPAETLEHSLTTLART